MADRNDYPDIGVDAATGGYEAPPVATTDRFGGQSKGFIGEFKLASFPQRFAAWAIDLTVLVVIYAVSWACLDHMTMRDHNLTLHQAAVSDPIAYLPAIFQFNVQILGGVIVVAHMLLQGLVGATPGKIVVGIRSAVVLVTDEGLAVSAPSVWRMVLRAPLRALEVVTVFGLFRPLWDKGRRTWADSATRTWTIVPLGILPLRIDDENSYVSLFKPRPSYVYKSDDAAFRRPNGTWGHVTP